MTWLTAVLDLPDEGFETAVDFWTAVTGTTPSTSPTRTGELATLVPADGDPYLRVQRVAQRGGVHLDVHDPEGRLPARAIRLGARVLGEPGHVVMASPSGLVFCVVGESLLRRPQVGDLVVDQVCLDLPAADVPSELAFWGALLDRATDDGGQFAHLARTPDEPLRVMLQRCGSATTPRMHLDLASTDRDASVARLLGLGAEQVRRTDRWTTLRDPAGLEHCVTDREPATGRLRSR